MGLWHSGGGIDEDEVVNVSVSDDDIVNVDVTTEVVAADPDVEAARLGNGI